MAVVGDSGAMLAVLVLSGVNTVSLIGIAFAAGKHVQTVSTLGTEVTTLRAIGERWAEHLPLLTHRVETIEAALGGRRTTDPK